MEIKYSKRFLKQFKKCPKKIQEAFIKKQNLFIRDTNHPRLRNHSLSGKFKNFYSINITGDWRALYQKDDNKIIIFVLIGTHSQLY